MSRVPDLSLIETHSEQGIWTVSLRVYSWDKRLIFERCNIQVQDPYSTKQEINLEWYFQEFLRNPFVEGVRFDETARSIFNYGESLFNQLFPKPDDWNVCSAFFTDSDAFCISICGGPTFQSLHWEALKHPLHSQPFSLQVSILRRVSDFGMSFAPEPLASQTPSSSKLNILLVVARPRGARDVGYRSISRPLVECLSNPQLNCNIDLVRPGTVSALEKQLKERPKGFYDVVHFDLHGVVSHYNPLVHNRLPPFQGTKAFLLFQLGEGSEDRVDAHRIAGILSDHGVPAAILNACQSGKETREPESSFASVLSRSGVSFVLGMCYSITVDAAVSAVAAMYGAFAHGKAWSDCVMDARKDLWGNKERTAYYGRKIFLEDWLLPVVYVNTQTVEASKKPSEKSPASSFNVANPSVANSGSRYLGPQLIYDFVGRDIDILEVETRLLSNEKINQLIIKGMMGAGKTSLLHHLGEWWQRTGLVERVFYFEYYGHAWTVPQLLTQIALQFYLPESPEFQKFDAASLSDQQQAVVEWLQAKRHLVILDNMEAITMKNSDAKLLYSQKMALARLIKAFSGIKSIMLLGSRSSLEWTHFTPERIYPLGGLDPQEGSLLVSRILQKFGKSGYLEDPSIRKLTDRLRDSPLALQVVLANVERKLPSQILHELEKGLVTLDTDEDSAQNSRSLRSYIEYSYANLCEQEQKLMLCLAPFVSHLVRPNLNDYEKALGDHQILAGSSSSYLQDLIRSIEYSGLISAHWCNRDWFIMQPVLPAFLCDKLHDMPETRIAINEAFCLHSENEMKRLFTLMMGPNAEERHAAEELVGFQFESSRHALELRLKSGKSMTVLFEALNVYLRRLSDSHRGVEFSNSMLSLLDELGGQRLLAYDVGALFFWAGKWQMWRRDYTSAEQHFRKALEINHNAHPSSSSSPRPKYISYAISSIHEQLGEIKLNQRELEESKAEYQKAIDTYPVEIPPEEPTPSNTAQGRLALLRREWSAASEHFHEAQKISLEHHRGEQEPLHLFNLGCVEQGKENWEIAKELYEQALEICIKYTDEPTKANIHFCLAQVMSKLDDDESMRRHCSDALRGYTLLRMPHKEADCYCFLANVAKKDKDWVQAEEYCRKAIEIVVAAKVDKDYAGHAYFASAEVLAAQSKKEDAKAQYEIALKFLKPGLDRAITTLQLGLIANAGGKYREAKEYLSSSLTWYEKNSTDLHVKAGILFGLGDAFLQDQPSNLCMAEQLYWRVLAIYIHAGDHQRRKVVETRLKSVVSKVSLACKQACDAYDAIVTDEDKASFALARLPHDGTPTHPDVPRALP